MKNRNILLLLGFVLLTQLYVHAQIGDSGAGMVLPKVDAPVLAVPAEEVYIRLSTMASVEPAYEYPDCLSCLGTYSLEEEPVCNYLSPNSVVNGEHLFWGKSYKACI